VVFKKPRDFWASTEGDGLAMFTSTNFVSDGTNFRLLDGVPAAGWRYSLPAPMEFLPPVPVEQLYAEAGLPVPEEMRAWCQDRGLDCRMSFVRTEVKDPKFEFTRHNDRAATFSVFDQDLKPDRRAVYTDADTGTMGAVDRVFSLNQFNFDEAHKFLIPRAVAYSAGLIDHFFRGRIDFTSDPENPGRYRLENLGTEALRGEFALYYDDREGTRREVPDARWSDVALAPGGSLANLSIGIPVEPEPASPGEYMLVFKGSMGEEKAEEGLGGFLGGFIGAVAGRKIARPGYLLITSRVSEDTYRVHRSRDLGQAWEDLGTYFDPGQGAIYAGSEHVMSTGSLSADGGRTWTAFPVSDPEARVRNADLRSRATALGGGRMLSTLHYDDPATPDQELSVQVWQSADWGASWTAGPASEALFGRAEAAVHLGSGNLVMKSFYPVGERENCLPGVDCLDTRPALFRSTDGGATWAMIYTGPELDRMAHLGKAQDFNGRLVPDPAGASVVLGNTYEGGQPRFLRSLDGGLSWQESAFPADLPGGFVLWYLVYGGEGVVFAYFSDNVSQHQLYVSTDYGTTWRLSGPLPERTAEPGLYGMTYVGETRAVVGWR
jgi:hypothetical protein